MREWARSERCSFSREQKFPGSPPASVFSEQSEILYMRGWVTCENLEHVTGAKAPWIITRISFSSRRSREIYARVVKPADTLA